MQMNEGLDTGDILLKDKHPISNTETSGSLTESLSVMGAHLILKTLDSINQIKHLPQNSSDAIYAKKILKAEAQIDWSQSALSISQKIRALIHALLRNLKLRRNSLKIRLLELLMLNH